jgi:3-deoxy-D-manno-octulosonic-acid transferase
VLLRRFLYNLLLVFVLTLGLPWMIYNLLLVKKRREGIGQRMGGVPRPEGSVIWCHAVSVGEVRAIEPMLSLLQNSTVMADRIVLSTVTRTGQDTARRECGFAHRIFYFPLDFSFSVKRALKRVDPQIFVTAETEIWPNFFSACFRRGIPVVIVNGRISDSSFPRYLKFQWFFKPFLQGVSMFLMQSQEDASRILELGARPETVSVTGNMKFDREIPNVNLSENVIRWGSSGFLFVVGSTHEGEEEAILESLELLDNQQLPSRVRTAIVPRHPERFDSVASLLDRKKISWVRYSEIEAGTEIKANIILVDAMGVLDGFYALAQAAFVGGSLVPTGGHNLLEPAMHGVPVLTGSHLHNFRDIANILISAGGCIVVDDVDELASAINSLVSDEKNRESMGRKAAAGSEKATGASLRNMEKISVLIKKMDL